MARKVFMSVLGTGFYEPCSYYLNDREKNIHTRFIQEATIRFFCSDWGENDQIVIFTTNKALTANYESSITKRKNSNNETTSYSRLAAILENLNLKVPFRNEMIKDGNDENEIWEVFTTIYNQLNEDDEVYFDITHSFRYLPMLLLILLSYSEYLKKTSIKSITYGNFEVSKNNNGLAPIMDLMPLVLLKDWSVAANNFESFGEVRLISSLCQDSLKPILREAKGSDKVATSVNSFSKELPGFVSLLKTCRGTEIISGEKALSLENKIAEIEETSLVPFNPIFARIKSQINRFASHDNIKNGFVAVEWCINNGLMQQGLTMLQETITSIICNSEGLDIVNEKNRTIISSVFNIIGQKIPENEWVGECAKTENIELTQKLCNNSLLLSLVNDYINLSNFRNDMNHSGMRNNPVKASNFENNLKQIFCSVLSKISNL
ncbi:MAG: TIGR02221 family CRISPR-associated protein [Mariniphaga sp.]|nr:TIGR02221 family CRISPR-associated protein [Mariniphaga sp.]